MRYGICRFSIHYFSSGRDNLVLPCKFTQPNTRTFTHSISVKIFTNPKKRPLLNHCVGASAREIKPRTTPLPRQGFRRGLQQRILGVSEHMLRYCTFSLVREREKGLFYVWLEPGTTGFITHFLFSRCASLLKNATNSKFTLLAFHLPFCDRINLLRGLNLSPVAS